MSLTTNNTSLQGILAKVNALPEAGGGSGGGVETCSVRVYCTSVDMKALWIHFSAFQILKADGTIGLTCVPGGETDTPLSPFDYTIENVVCGSTVLIDCHGDFHTTIAYQNCEHIGELTSVYASPDGFQIKTPAGGTAVINFEGYR